MEEISEEAMIKSERIGLTWVIVFGGTYFLFIVYVFIEEPQKNPDASWITSAVFVVTYILLTVLYAVVIVNLNKVMRKMAGNFRGEIFSVNCQFLFFFLAYLIRSGESVLAFLVKHEDDYIDKYPVTTMINTTVKCFMTEILPSFMILFLHYRAFNKRTLAKNYTSDYSETE